MRQTHLHGEKVAPRYRNLQREHREGKGKEEDKVDDDEEEEEFINTSGTKRAEDDDERYEDDSFEDESNSPVNKQRLREPQNYSSEYLESNTGPNGQEHKTSSPVPKPTIITSPAPRTAMSIIAMESKKMDEIIQANPEQRSIHEEHARLGLPKNLTYAVNLSRKRLPVIIFDYLTIDV